MLQRDPFSLIKTEHMSFIYILKHMVMLHSFNKAYICSLENTHAVKVHQHIQMDVCRPCYSSFSKWEQGLEETVEQRWTSSVLTMGRLFISFLRSREANIPYVKISSGL